MIKGASVAITTCCTLHIVLAFECFDLTNYFFQGFILSICI
jgi:hypothetical protein